MHTSRDFGTINSMSELFAFVRDAFHRPKTRTFTQVNDFLACMTLVSVLGIVLETVESLSHLQAIFITVEYVSVALFSLEYVGRIWAAPDKFKYVFSFFGLVDLLSILPTYVQLANFTFLKSVRLLRILRFLRVLRLSKIARLEEEKVAVTADASHLYIINIQIYFVALFTAVTCWGCLAYIAEGHQDALRNIPLAMIWAIKIIMGGVPNIPVTTLWGEVVMIGTRFTGLVLLGLLIHVVGTIVTKLIFGSDIRVSAQTRKRRK